MNTTPIENCSLTPDTELTIRLAKEKGWSRFLIFPNGSLIGTSPDEIQDEPVPNFGRILKDAALDLLNVAITLCNQFAQAGVNAVEDSLDPHEMLHFKARAAIAKAKGE